MNVFYLHPDPTLCAMQLCDKILTRMILETGQMFSTIYHRAFAGLYQPIHGGYRNHPSLIWAARTVSNRAWLYRLFEEMSHEYFYRTGKVHKTWDRISPILDLGKIYDTPLRTDTPIYIDTRRYLNKAEDTEFFTPPQVVPKAYRVHRGRRMRYGNRLSEYQSLATIMAYRRFYIHDKAPHCKWTKREPPEWFTTKNLWDIMNAMIAIENGNPPYNRSRISELGEPFYTILSMSGFDRGHPPRVTAFNENVTPLTMDFGVLEMVGATRRPAGDRVEWDLTAEL